MGIATLAGWLVSLTGIPLGWLIGAMLCIATLSFLGLPVEYPDKVMPLVKASVGTMLGASVTMGVVASLSSWWPSFLFMAVVMLAGGAVNFMLMRRVFGFGQTDAALCAVPGGITEMILLCETTRGEQWRVAIVHALRIALAILIIPVMIGWFESSQITSAPDVLTPGMSVTDWGWFALCVAIGVVSDRFEWLPARLIIVPLVFCAALHLTGVTGFVVPEQISNAVQVFIGINVGARFVGVAPRLLLQVGLVAVAVVAVQIAFAFGAALLAASYLHVSPLVLVLAYAPGGLDEMSLIAVAMGQEVVIVGFHHITHVLGALFAGPLILNRLSGVSDVATHQSGLPAWGSTRHRPCGFSGATGDAIAACAAAFGGKPSACRWGCGRVARHAGQLAGHGPWQRRADLSTQSHIDA